MKKLTKQELTKILKNNYFIGSFYCINLYKGQTQQYSLYIINYAYGVLYLRFGGAGWNYLYYGETHYSFSKSINELIKLLDSNYKPLEGSDHE